jgi:hypothetical protein
MYENEIIVCGVVVFVFVWFYILPRKRFPVRVDLWEERANGYSFRSDRAGRIKKPDGTFYYRLKGKKENTKPSAYDNIMTTNKGLKLLLYSPGPGEYYPIKFDKGTISTIDEDMKFWFAQQIKQAYERAATHSMLERFMPAIMMVMFAVSMCILFYALPNYSSMLAQPWQNVASSITQATSTLQGTALLGGAP